MSLDLLAGQEIDKNVWPSAQYGERKRPGHRSRGLLTDVQVAFAPRTVPPGAPQSFKVSLSSSVCANKITAASDFSRRQP